VDGNCVVVAYARDGRIYVRGFGERINGKTYRLSGSKRNCSQPDTAHANSRFVVFTCANKVYIASIDVKNGKRSGPKLIGSGRGVVVDQEGKTVAWQRGSYVYLGTRKSRTGKFKARKVGVGNGPSITSAGSFLTYDRNGELFIYTVNNRELKTLNVTTDGFPLPHPAGFTKSSAKGNYVVFETFGLTPAGRRNGDPTQSTQIYLKYLGGK
jgi:hypothetical protein